MTRPADSASRLITGLGGLGLIALALTTLVDPGATRMHASPWSLAYAAALLVPAGILLARLLDRTRPFAAPSGPWLFTALAAALIVLLSGLTSPYRGPSLLWSTPLLSGVAVFLVAFDWLHASPTETESRKHQLLTWLGFAFVVVAFASIVPWLATLPGKSFAQIVDARNPFPLGHSNYTAGLALLMLPCFAALSHRTSGKVHVAWASAGLLALAMLISSGSRGGFLGLGALILGAVFASRLGWKKSLALAVGAAAVAVLLALANPRTRAMILPSGPATAPNASNLQRQAMLDAGLALGRERPLLGWGPGTTPLAFPHVRNGLAAGGVENVLQLHCLPVQIWAELGTAGLIVLVAGGFLVLRHARRSPLAAVALFGYLVFALTDYQLDVPVFAFALALLTALLASPATSPMPAAPRIVSLSLRFSLILLAAFARPDPTPKLNVDALALAQTPAGTDQAVEKLQTSLTINPVQEIAHFNLAWILVVRQPALAETHFLAAARLVPDKGGVYFGLGLACLNQGHRERAVRAFALECINDPIFLVSPWWRDPAVGGLRSDTFTLVRRLLREADQTLLSNDARRRREIAYLDALLTWVEGNAPPGSMLSAANTAERTAYFAARPARPDFDTSLVSLYRRDRPGYPVLMRNLDLPVPTDLFDVQENSLAVGELRYLFPSKGWLPAPALAALLILPLKS